MVDIVEEFVICPRTCAIVPVAHIDYQSIAITFDGTFYIDAKPLDIVKNSCLEWGVSYEGRLQAIKHHFSQMKKFVIPIYPERNIVVFPTHSPQKFHCCWINPLHIERVEEVVEKVHGKIEKQVLVTFKNNKILLLRLSLQSFQKQVERAYMFLKFFSTYERDNRFLQNRTVYYFYQPKKENDK